MVIGSLSRQLPDELHRPPNPTAQQAVILDASGTTAIQSFIGPTVNR
jgi:hypothetical protein